jgi:hypothetical protein
MKKVFSTMLVIGASAILLTGSLSFAADQPRIRDRDRDRIRDGSCLTSQSPGAQSRQSTQQRLNQGSGSQTRSQKQFRGAR